METKVVTIEGREYTLGRIKTGVGRRLRASIADSSDYSVAMVSASLRAGGMPEATPEWVDENIPWFGLEKGIEDSPFQQLLVETYAMHGYKMEFPRKGESQPEAGPAAGSTSTSSTVN